MPPPISPCSYGLFDTVLCTLCSLPYICTLPYALVLPHMPLFPNAPPYASMTSYSLIPRPKSHASMSYPMSPHLPLHPPHAPMRTPMPSYVHPMPPSIPPPIPPISSRPSRFTRCCESPSWLLIDKWLLGLSPASALLISLHWLITVILLIKWEWIVGNWFCL